MHGIFVLDNSLEEQKLVGNPPVCKKNIRVFLNFMLAQMVQLTVKYSIKYFGLATKKGVRFKVNLYHFESHTFCPV